jgi:4-amino-4-deoxy-L-arabinose transferase-like glycosyltransferase
LGTLFVITVALVDPFRANAMSDDWSYARMVRELLTSGRHVADAWVAANPVAQVQWGALFSALFGYSQSTLRISTLVLSAAALCFFHLLCRDNRLGRDESGILALVLFSSPLFFRLSFSFMTDVPFLAMFLLALLLYGRALTRESVGLAFLASLAGSAAILIRQFGAVLLPAIALVWLLWSGRRRAPQILFCSLLLPTFATGYQLWMGAFEPNWTARRLAFDQRHHLMSSTLLGDALWRPAVVLVYLALFALPLCLPLLTRLIADRRGHDELDGSAPASRSFPVEFLVVSGIVATLAAGAIGFGRPWRLPLLPWNLEAVEHGPLLLSVLLTLVTVAGAALIGGSLWRRFREPLLRPATATGWLLEVAAGFYLLSQLVFVQFGDEYLVPLLPCALIVVGRDLWSDRPAEQSDLRPVRLVALVLLMISSLYVRSLLSVGEARWKGGDLALQLVGSPESVSSSWEWDCYHGAFDRFVASLEASGASPSLAVSLNDFFFRWLPRQNEQALYLSTPFERAPAESASLRVLARVPYRDFFLRPRDVYVVARPAFELTGCTGAFPAEGSGPDWWRWTADRIDCRFVARTKLPTSGAVAFDYMTAATLREVRLEIGGRAFSVSLQPNGMRSFRTGTIQIAQDPLEISIRLADGSLPNRLSERDPRVAAFLIKNLRVVIPLKR